MKEELNELQLMMLDMIKWFHSFCNKYDIRYYVVGGTMLGAVRHNGFIPWDDDIDVGIPRKDYERLLANKNTWLADETRYYLESYKDGNKDFEYSYAKIYDTHTTLAENCRCHTKRGIFIDVFPIDGIGNSREDALINYAPIEKYVNLLMTRTCELRRNRKVYKNIAILVSRLVPSFLLNNNSLITKINKLCAERDFDTSIFVGNLLGNWGKKEIMPRDYFGNPTLYQFEDTKVFGPEKFDEYLTNVYKNWRKLPPPEKQKSEHDFLYLNLHKSYLDNK